MPKRIVDKVYLSKSGTADFDADALESLERHEVEGALNDGTSLEGISKKFLVNIHGKEYIVKNHSYVGYDDNQKRSFYKAIKRNIAKRMNLVTSGTLDVRYRFIGTPVSRVNVMSIREVLTSLLLTAVEVTNSKNGVPPFHTARMRLYIDQYPGTTHPRFRVLSEKFKFKTLDKFAFSATTNKPLITKDKKVQRDEYAMLNKNRWYKTENRDGKEKLVFQPIDKESLGYGAIISALFADYDVPGTNGKNFGVVESDSKLAFFDFGNSLASGWLKRTDVTSDLMPQDSYIGGLLNQKRRYGFNKPANLIRRYKGKHVINVPLEDKIAAFKNIHKTFINPSTGKPSHIIANIKYQADTLFHSMLKEGIISYHEEQYYKRKTYQSLNLFVKRIKHIEKVLAPRISLSPQELAMLEMMELITSKIIPTPLSKAGFIIHNDSPVRGETHRNSFEIYDNNIVTTSGDAIKQLCYCIYRETGKNVKPLYKGGFYQISLNNVPDEWKVSPHSEAGAAVLNKTMNHNDIARNLYKKYPSLFIKEGGVEQTSQEDIDKFVDEILDTINKIKKDASTFRLSKDTQQKIIFQLLDTACHGNVNSLSTLSDEEKHPNLWEVIHQLVEKDKNPRSSIELQSPQRLRIIENQFAPDKVNSIYELSGNTHVKQS